METVLEEVLAKLLVPQTEIVKEATERLKVLFKEPNIVPGLCCVLRSSASLEVRSYAAVLLRKKVSKRRKWFLLPPDLQNGLKISVISSFQEESEKSVKYAIAQLTGTIAKHELSKHKWPELLHYIQISASSLDVRVREMGIFLLSVVAFSAAQQLQPHLKGLLRLFRKTLLEDAVTTIPYYTIKALTPLCPMMGSEVMQEFQVLIPKVMNVVGRLVMVDEDKACEAFQLFDELVECEVGFVVPHIKSLIEFCLEIAINNDFGDEVRVKSLMVVSWLARLKNKTILKHNLIHPILKALFTIMFSSAVTDDTDDPCDDDVPHEGAESNSPTSVAAQVIDILALHSPAENLMQPLMGFVEPALSSEDPRHRKSAYITLAVTAEGCADYIRSRYFQLYLQSVCKGVQDPHSVVRNSALFALGQFSEYLQPEIAQFASDILPLLFASLHDVCQQLRDGRQEPSSCSKIFYALENFCENLEEEKIVSYLPAIMERLFDALNCSSSVNIQELAVSTIGATAGAAGPAILPYFDEIMSTIKVFLSPGQSEQTRLLQIQSLDTLGVLARTVGSETFRPLVHECMQLGFSLINAVDDPDIRRCAYSLFASISTILKEEISSYLPEMLNHMTESLQSTDGVTLHTGESVTNAMGLFVDMSDDDDNEEDLGGDDDEDEESEDEDIGCNVVNSYLEEKEDTCSSIREIASNAGHAFIPFLEATYVKIYILIEHPAAAIRRKAVEALGALCVVFHNNLIVSYHDKVIVAKKTAAASKMATTLLSKLIVMAREDKERTVAMGCLDVINDLVNSLQRSLLEKSGSLHSIVAVVKDVMQSKVACQDENDSEGVVDLVDDGQQAEHDALLMEYAADILPSVAKAVSGEEFSPYFAGVLSLLLNKTNPTCPVSKRSFTIGTIAECAAAMKFSIIPFVSHLLPVYLSAAQDDNDELRSNAIFGLGILAEFGSDSMYPHYPTLLQLLSNTLSNEKDPRTMDNICGAVARMILANIQAVPLDEVVPVLIQCLPLRKDFEENATMLKCISYLFTLKYSQVLNHMPKILEILATISDTDQINEEGQTILDNLVVDVGRNFPMEFRAVLLSMSDELRLKLTSVLQKCE